MAAWTSSGVPRMSRSTSTMLRVGFSRYQIELIRCVIECAPCPRVYLSSDHLSTIYSHSPTESRLMGPRPANGRHFEPAVSQSGALSAVCG